MISGNHEVTKGFASGILQMRQFISVRSAAKHKDLKPVSIGSANIRFPMHPTMSCHLEHSKPTTLGEGWNTLGDLLDEETHFRIMPILTVTCFV